VPRAEGPSLAELQRRFFELITAAEGVAQELATRGIPPPELATMLVSDAKASAVERLDIYANMYFYRILDVLRSDYPKLLAVVGDGAFHNLATGYLLAHPSRHPSLRFVGAALPEYLARDALAADRPWLTPLAALEWARVDVFDRADVALLTREALASLAPEAFASLALRLVPAHALVPAAYAVEETWRALENDDDQRPDKHDHDDDHDHDVDHDHPVVPPPRAEAWHAILVWRRGVVVQHRALEAAERGALELVRAGDATFGTLCSHLGAQLESEAEAAARAVQLLSQWLADELLAAG
jgi:hypothetical protein